MNINNLNTLTLLARISVSHVHHLNMREVIYRLIDELESEELKRLGWDIVTYNFKESEWALRYIRGAVNLREGDKQRNYHLFRANSPIRELIGW